MALFTLVPALVQGVSNSFVYNVCHMHVCPVCVRRVQMGVQRCAGKWEGL